MGYYDNFMNQQMMNNGYQGGYNYYGGNNFRPTMGQQNQMQFQNINTPQLPPQEVMKVNGRNGANALNLAPNSSLLASDLTQPIVWFIVTDGAGYKTVTPYSITPFDEEKEEFNMNDLVLSLDERISNLERMVLNNESNSKQPTKRKTKSSSEPESKHDGGDESNL